MGARTRALAAAAVAAAGVALAAGPAAAAPAAREAGSTSVRAMDYRQYHGHYPTRARCAAVGEEYLWPRHPGGADDYECVAAGGGWDLYLIFGS
ncbi:hypothetical protein [Sphaerisporangium sp. TRM90804]|uniref:hypothetical protein n=1 Tax=Sphaerisporangium sp. TRM90804 TaxID=3031113 RepID=UPI00244CDB8D|nr:hypothetical protein [Sphaerisporangium sp. TRM90804]MDH2426235.1 hypothetical protein [Sphaerisporangium sp. TRM90804]